MARHDAARDARARALSFALRTFLEKKAAEVRGCKDDPKGVSDDRVQRMLPP